LNAENEALSVTTFTCAGLSLIIHISVAVYGVRAYLNFGYGLAEKGKV